jgi:Flp pilus assembly pilin Flp
VGTSHREGWRGTRGASFVEYAIVVGVVALLALHAFTVFGTDAKTGIGMAGADLARLGF